MSLKQGTMAAIIGIGLSICCCVPGFLTMNNGAEPWDFRFWEFLSLPCLQVGLLIFFITLYRKQ